MTIIIKIMADEKISDRNKMKSFKIITVGDNQEFVFRQGPSCGQLLILDKSDIQLKETIYKVPGNAYVVNENGITIATFDGCDYEKPKNSPSTFGNTWGESRVI